MPTNTFKSGKLTFDFTLGTHAKAVRRDPDAPLHILIMGDFGGQSAGKPLPVDCDNFEQVMAALKPRAKIAELSFASLEDFHPDRLLRAIERLDERGAGGALPDPKVRLALETSESNTDLLGRLMGEPPPAPAPVAKQKVDIAALLKSAVGSSVIAPNPAEEAARAASNLSRSSVLRRVLHDRHFQTLEANWRALDLLVRNFGGDEEVRLSVVDCDSEKFASELASHDDLEATPFLQLLRKRSSDQRFALVLGLYTFEPTLEHMDVLARIAKICSAQQATFIAAASSAFVGSKSFSLGAECNPLPPEIHAEWEKVRALAEASRIALALPRFLLRQPYGAAGEPIDTFAFEELTPDLPHEEFLWGNPAILCGHALAEAFLADGWAASTSGFADVNELPVYRFKTNGETKVKPCAEAWIPESVAERISAQGLIPILSIKGRDAVRVAGLRAVSSTDGALSLQ